MSGKRIGQTDKQADRQADRCPSHLVVWDIPLRLHPIVIGEEVCLCEGGGGRGEGGGEEGGDLLAGPHTEGSLLLVLRGGQWERVSVFSRVEPSLLL